MITSVLTKGWLRRTIYSTISTRRWLALSHTQSGKIVISPNICSFDEPISIKLSELKPYENVTIRTTVKDLKGKDHISTLFFRCDGKGCVDLNTDASIGGDFEGIFPMAPICLLHSTEPELSKMGYRKVDDSPDVYKLQLLRGHVQRNELETYSVLSETYHIRTLISEGVEKVNVNTGKIRGALYIPKGEGPFPGVIDLHGSGGGLVTTRASLLASKGIATLALAYLRYADLPKFPAELDIAYFEEAVQFLLKHEKILKPSVGVFGFSKGADLAMAMGIFINAIKSVVAVNGYPASATWGLRVGDTYIPPLPMDASQIVFKEDNLTNFMNFFQSPANHPECCLPIEDAKCDFLFICAEDDQMWHSCKETLRVIDKLKEKGKTNWKYFSYKGAGHLIEPPYNPFSEIFLHSTFKLFIESGGSPLQHMQAQVEMWKVAIAFLKNSLSNNK